MDNSYLFQSVDRTTWPFLPEEYREFSWHIKLSVRGKTKLKTWKPANFVLSGIDLIDI